MPEAMQWVLLEIGLLVIGFISATAFTQWRKRRATEQAIHALSQQVRRSESERRRTLTGILTGAHRLPESHSAELADDLIRSERVFFRYCFEAMLSQDRKVVAALGQNLYNVLDEYLRKCAPESGRSAPAIKTAVSPYEREPDDIFGTAQPAMNRELPLTPDAEMPVAATAVTVPIADDEIDWDAAFAEQFVDKATFDSGTSEAQEAPVQAEAPPDVPDVSAMQDTLYQLLDGADTEQEESLFPMESSETAQPADEDDAMADWGAAMEEQAAAATTAPLPNHDKAFDLGWDDAFLEETAVTKPEKDEKKGS